MHYTRSIIARKLRRIARLLRYADYARAKLGIEDALKELSRYNETIDELDEKITEKLNSFSNIFTMAFTPESSNKDEFFQNSFETFRNLYPKAKKVLEQAKNASSVDEMKRIIHYQREPLDRILRLMIEIKSTFDDPQVKTPYNQMSRRIKSGELEYKNFAYHVNQVLDDRG